jgi:hypothetical protein
MPEECLFVADPLDPRRKRCSRVGCGRELLTDSPPDKCFAKCRSADAANGPPAISRAINFVKAAFHQLPLTVDALLTADESKAFRSREEIEAIAAICKACPLLIDGVCSHKNCGCNIDVDRNQWWSKLAWRSAQCPDDPPRWT